VLLERLQQLLGAREPATVAAASMPVPVLVQMTHLPSLDS
jgi:hypothetical protein